MASARTRLLLIAATLVSGILAGGVVDRVVVGGPAWHELGVEAWAVYSRHADLGNGLVAYALEAIGGALLIISAAVSNYFDRDAGSMTTVPLYCAVVFSLVGMVLTAKTAPIMLGLAAAQSHSATQHSFDEFSLWGLYVRGTTILFTFIAVTCALAGLYQRRNNSP